MADLTPGGGSVTLGPGLSCCGPALPFLPGPILLLPLRNLGFNVLLTPGHWLCWPSGAFLGSLWGSPWAVWSALPILPHITLPMHPNNPMTNYPAAKLNWLLHQIPWIIGTREYIAH